MKYDEFLNHVTEHGGPTDREHADAAAKQVLAALGQRLAGNEPHDLASQLPAELQDPLLRSTSAAEIDDDLDEFLRRVADREGRGCDTEQALRHARAVLGTIAGFVSGGEIHDLLPAAHRLRPAVRTGPELSGDAHRGQPTLRRKEDSSCATRR